MHVIGLQGTSEYFVAVCMVFNRIRNEELRVKMLNVFISLDLISIKKEQVDLVKYDIYSFGDEVISRKGPQGLYYHYYWGYEPTARITAIKTKGPHEPGLHINLSLLAKCRRS